MTVYSKPIEWGPTLTGHWKSAHNASALSAGYALNDADDAIAMTFCAPIDGTIDTIGCYVTAITGNPPAYNVALVTVSTTTGLPEAGNYGGSATVSYDFTATGWHWITLTTPATANAGDFVAMLISPGGGSAPDASNCASIHYDDILESALPSSWLYASSWAKQTNTPALAVRYSTGDIVGLPAVGFLFAETDTGQTPDEVGNKFILPVAMNCIGTRFHVRYFQDNAPFTVKLYDSSDNVLQSVSINDEDMVGGNSAQGYSVDLFWDAVALSAGATYRITVLPGGTNGLFMALLDFESDASKDNAVCDGANWDCTYRTDAGAWTDDGSAVCWISLLVSTIAFSTGGGAGSYGFAG